MEHGESGPDEAFAAFAAADPTRMSLDIDDMRTMVDTGHHEHRAPRTRVAAAGIAALIALTAGAAGGYQVAAQRDQPVTSSVAQAAAAGVLEPGDASVAGSEADKMASMPVGGRVILEPGPGLGDDAAQRTGYVLAGTVDRAAAAKQLADMMGLPAPDKSEDGSYTAGDPQAATATVGSDPAASWWYSDAANSPWNCATSSQEGTCAPISGTPMSDDAAIAAAKDLLKGLGLAADEARWSVADASWFGTGPDNNPIPFRHVSAEVVLQDMPTGMTWTADLAPDGSVSSATGFFATFTATAAYATVGATTATLRSQDPQWSAFGPVERTPADTITPLADTAVRDATPAAGLQAAYDSGGRPLLVDSSERVTVTQASASLAVYYLADGTTALLPSWDLTDGQRTWVQIAIAEKYLVAAD